MPKYGFSSIYGMIGKIFEKAWNVYVLMLKHASRSLNITKQSKYDQISPYKSKFAEVWFLLNLRWNRHEIWKTQNVYISMLQHASHTLNIRKQPKCDHFSPYKPTFEEVQLLLNIRWNLQEIFKCCIQLCLTDANKALEKINAYETDDFG